MKRVVISFMMWFGLAATSLMFVSCQREQISENPAPIATGGAPKGAADVPVASASTGPDGNLLPGWATWKGKKNPMPDDPAKARDLFVKNCAPCHGNEGKGDGPAGLALSPKPRNFATEQFKYGSADWQLMRTIWEGIPATAMAGWTGRMSQEESWILVPYVKSLTSAK